MADEPTRGLQAWPLAKTSPPRPRTLVSRGRLLEPLNASTTAGRVTLVVAPGGSGKTSLLSDWARQAPMPVAWYTLDAADRDMGRMVAGICAAIERVRPGSTDLARRALEHGSTETAAIGMLLGSLEDVPLTLVLDDFQHLDDLPEATALWEHLFRFRPSCVALVILSRSVPLLGFAMLAAMDALLGLGRTELSFDADEAARLLDAHGLDSRSAAHFVVRSDGWATGVLLLARAAPGGVRFLHARTDALMDQLGSEVLAALPDDLREFLLESATLGPATSDEANAILGRQDSLAYYAEVAARGLFVVHEGGVYRYHDLFADYFVSVLKMEQPERLRAIRERASEWWVEHDDVPRALGLLADDDDWPALAGMLERERGTLWSRGMWGTALAMVERLPTSFRSPRLLSLCGYGRAQRGEHAEALSYADAGMAAARGEDEWLSPAILHADALLLAGRYEECVRSTEAALAVAQRVSHDVAVIRLYGIRGRARLLLGKTEAGKADLLAALNAHISARDTDGEALTLYNLALSLVEAGIPADCEEYLARATAIWRQAGNGPMLANTHNVWAMLRALTGDLDTALKEARQALSIIASIGNPLLECATLATLASVHADAGDGKQADETALKTIELAERIYAIELRNEAYRTRITVSLAKRDRAGAKQIVEEARQLTLTPTDNALLDMLEGALALRSRAHTRAIDLLGRGAEKLEKLNRPQYAARAYLLRAEAFLATGVVSRAEDSLNRAASLVLPFACEGFLRPTARMTRQVLSERSLLRKLRRETRHLLDRLAATVPALSVVASPDVDEGQPQILRISPFGQGTIELGGRPIEVSALPPRARELLFYAARQQRVMPRAELMQVIWEDDQRAAQSLWDASRHLRRVLGERSWSIRGGSYALNLAVEDDGLRFESQAVVALGSGPELERLTASEQALALVSVGGCLEWCDSMWAAALRARIGHLSMSVALVLARLYEQLDRHEEAIAACRKAIAIDPLDEAPRLAIMRCLSAHGRVQAAIAEYREYRALLREELATEPSMELRKFVSGLGR